MADTQGSTVLSLRAVDNPFNAGADQRFTINEGEDLTLSGDITGGFGDVTYRWYVSSDGGEHWDLVERAHGTSLDLKNMKAGEYIYRLVASDMYSNTAHQDFYVTVKGNGIADSVAEAVSNAVKTGDSLRLPGLQASQSLLRGLLELQPRSAVRARRTHDDERIQDTQEEPVHRGCDGFPRCGCLLLLGNRAFQGLCGYHGQPSHGGFRGACAGGQ